VISDPRAVQHPEHACGDAVIALIVIEAGCGVGVERVEAGVLQLIRPHLVGETKPAGFVSQIEMMPPPRSSSRAEFWSLRSQRREPNTLPVRQGNAAAREQH
jgi:hypothetical protein